MARRDRTRHLSRRRGLSQFGSKSVMEAVVSGIDAAAQNAALMDVWGTNPEAAFTADLDQLMARKTVSEAQVKKLQARSIKTHFALVNGTANIEGNPRAARFNANVRAAITMAHPTE